MQLLWCMVSMLCYHSGKWYRSCVSLVMFELLFVCDDDDDDDLFDRAVHLIYTITIGGIGFSNSVTQALSYTI